MSHQGRRKKTDAIFTDATCTPLWLAERINDERPDLDLDPCSNPRSHIISRWSYSLEKKLDGLRLPWRGSIFRNNPFGWPLPWCEKALVEMRIGRCTELINLCKLDTSTEWWTLATAPVERHGQLWFPDFWAFKERVQYEEHPEILRRRQELIDQWEASGRTGKKPPPVETSNNFCSVVLHHRFDQPRLNFDDIAVLWERRVNFSPTEAW